MAIALFLILAIAGTIILLASIARSSGQSPKGHAPRPTLGLRPDPSDEYHRSFHQKAVHEAERAAPNDRSANTSIIEVSPGDGNFGTDRSAAAQEARLPKDLGEVSVPLDADLLKWLPQKFVVLDLETTGLSPQTNEIVEIGAIRATVGMDTHATFQTLVKPQWGISEQVSRINGITQHMLDSDGRPADQSLREFAEFIGDLPLVTFNASFDMGFLWSAGTKYGVDIRNRYACALRMSRRAWPQLSSHRLPDLARWAKLPSDNTHRALGDCRRALLIFVAAVSQIRKGVSWEYCSLDWRVMAEYNKKRDANRAFCAETRPWETKNIALAASRYAEAMERMYEYEADVDGRYADASILDRLTICLWKSQRYGDIVNAVDRFTRSFSHVDSSLMRSVLKRRERAKDKLGSISAPEIVIDGPEKLALDEREIELPKLG